MTAWDASWNLTPLQQQQLELHWQLVKRAQQDFNLTAILDDQQARDKHYADCLALLPLLAQQPRPCRLLDIGSGAGFPGLVIAVTCPDIELTLLEATQKKCAFLQSCRDELGLPQVSIVNDRAEQAGREPQLRESFDLVTARAVASLNVLIELALPLLRLGGRLLAMKGADWQQELEQAATALQLLGGRVGEVQLYSLANGDKRALLLIEKIAPTADKYPRRPGMPNKRPL